MYIKGKGIEKDIKIIYNIIYKEES